MEQKARGKRKYRDTLFKFIFSNEKHKDFALSLYNVLNHSDYSNPQDLQIVTLENALYITMYNDAAILVSNEFWLYEQQSTWNANMAYRCLEYIVAEYQGYIAGNRFDKYIPRMFHLPSPHFVVFYNGSEMKPERTEIHLSDMYEGHKKGDLELTVHVYNINEGNNEGIKQNCRALYEYCWVTDAIGRKMNEMSGNTDRDQLLGKAISEVLDSMPDEFVIKPLLMKHKKEVIGMLFEEFDETRYQQAMKNYGQIEREEGREEGSVERAKSTALRLLKRGRDTDQEIADLTGLHIEEVKKLHQSLH